MGKLIYISGGARSGKSSYAESRARAYSSVAYIATAVCTDDEMAERIARHRTQRPPFWRTIEVYRDIGTILANLDEEAALLDCLTVMVTNLLFEQECDWDKLSQTQKNALEEAMLSEVEALIAGAKASKADVIAVSNELGMGLVPEYPLGRLFRDIAGKVNCAVAQAADEAWFVVSGIPMRTK